MCTRTEIHNLKITVRSRQITFLCLRLFIMYMGCGYVCGSVSLYRWINVHVCHSFSIILPEEKAEWIMAILFHAEHLKSLRRAAILSFSFFSPLSLFLYRNLSISLSIFSLSHSHICLRREDWAFTIFSVCHLFLINLFILSEELTVNINLRSPSLLQASKFSHSFFLLIPF